MPEVLTEVDEQPAKASNADLCRAAQAHYDKISTAAHEWHSAIPKAIDAYYEDAERSRLEREVIEAAREFTDDSKPQQENWDALVAYRKLCGAVDALILFEAKQETK